MTEWMTEEEAAAYLNFHNPDGSVNMKKLTYARYRGKVKHAKPAGVVLYKTIWLDDFLNSSVKGGTCEANQSSSNERIPLAGKSTSPSMADRERSALIRAKEIVARQNLSSVNGSLREKGRNSPQPMR